MDGLDNRIWVHRQLPIDLDRDYPNILFKVHGGYAIGRYSHDFNRFICKTGNHINFHPESVEWWVNLEEI